MTKTKLAESKEKKFRHFRVGRDYLYIKKSRNRKETAEK